MEPKDKQPNFLDLLRDMLEDHLGKAEFVAAFENVVKRVEQIDERTAKEVEQIATTLRTMFDELKTGNTDNVSGFKEELRTLFAEENTKALQRLQTAIDAANERVSELRDGEDADEDAIAKRVKAEIIAPITENIAEQLPALGSSIRDGLELLQGDDRLDKSAIKGIDELETEIARVAARPTGGGLSQMALQHALSKLITHQKFDVTSATTTSTLTHKVAGDVCIWLRYNGVMLHYGDQYTISGTTITYTFTMEDNSVVEATYIRG